MSIIVIITIAVTLGISAANDQDKKIKDLESKLKSIETKTTEIKTTK